MKRQWCLTVLFVGLGVLSCYSGFRQVREDIVRFQYQEIQAAKTALRQDYPSAASGLVLMQPSLSDLPELLPDFLEYRIRSSAIATPDLLVVLWREEQSTIPIQGVVHCTAVQGWDCPWLYQTQDFAVVDLKGRLP